MNGPTGHTNSGRIPTSIMQYVIWSCGMLPPTAPENLPARVIEAWHLDKVELAYAVAEAAGTTYDHLARRMTPEEGRGYWGLVVRGHVASKVAAGLPGVLGPGIIRDLEATARKQLPWTTRGQS